MISTKHHLPEKMPSKFGDILTDPNDIHEKKLQEEIKRLQASRSTREIDWFLQQRAFVINNVFEGDELKFAKFRGDRRPHFESKREMTYHSTEKVYVKQREQENEQERSWSGYKTPSKLLRDKLFINDHRPSNESENMQKIAFEEKRLSMHGEVMNSQLASTPIKSSRNDHSYETREVSNFEDYAVIEGMDSTATKEKSCHQKIVSSIPRLIHKTTLKFQSVKPLTVENIQILESKNRKKGSFKLELMKRFLLSDSNYDFAILPHLEDRRHNGHFQPSPSGVNQTNEKSQEELLLKLTKSLPNHLLQESERMDSPTSGSKKAKKYLKNVLGLHQMKQLMLKREKHIASLDRRDDPRLNGLINYLES